MSQWSHYHHMTAFSEFLAYKTRVPVRGAIMLNQEMDEVVLVKGWKKGANWSFPRGKINKGEPDLDCAIREVYEETGFDVRAAGLVKDEDNVKYIEITMREQHMRLYVFPGVPKDTHFEPRTRKEISKIEWYKLSELPTLKKSKQHDEGLAVANANKFYMVAPFLNPLKKWISQQKKVASKTQAGMNPVEGYASMDENGQRASSTPVIPSDLPEVTLTDDVSHIKQLLNIGAMPDAVQGQQPVQAPAIDKSKSDALLGLLRSGPQDAAPRLQNQAMSIPNHTHPGAPPIAQQAHFAPDFFPGFPQQQQHVAPSDFVQQASTVLPRGPMHSNGRPAISSAQYILGPGLTYAAQHELSGSAVPRVPETPEPNFYNYHLQPVPSNFAPTTHVAPFQATGDPQFSQSTQPSQVPGARVPPARELPRPKLNSQTQALLDVFKGNASHTAKSPHGAPLGLPGQEQSQIRKTSHQQESLLDLFKGTRAMPVELGGHPVSSAPSAEKQILQRPSPHPEPSLQRGNNALSAADGPAQAAATLSGPMGTPQLDPTPKKSPKKATIGPHRRNRSGRRDPSQPQQLSSPITILPRPQSAKRDTSTSVPQPPVQQVSSQGQAPQTKAPEPVKPFQPQILRRSDKADYEGFLMHSSKMESASRKPSLAGSQTNTSELSPQTSFDRRPSQNAAQKDALLALFGKAASPSPTSAVQLDSRSANQHPSTVSGLVSPLSSFHLPSNGGSLSRHGTPAAFEGDVKPTTSNRIASPSNKEFLLGYLQGVAKSNV